MLGGLLSGGGGMGAFESHMFKTLLSTERKQAEEDEAMAEEAMKKKKLDTMGLEQRKKGMRGGGRVGLMFRGNQQGVER